jgi:tRNA G18 (ribose-2'-O)-methylase SpoU
VFGSTLCENTLVVVQIHYWPRPNCRIEAMHDHKNSLVHHARDPRFLNLRSLQTPQGRARTGLYVIEGIRHVARALEEHATIESLFTAPQVLTNPFGQKMAHKLRKSGVPARSFRRSSIAN